MEAVDLMVHPLASIMGIQLYNIGGCRPYDPPSFPQLRAIIIYSPKIIIQESYNALVCD